MSTADLERFWLEKQYASADNPLTKAPDDASVIKLVKAFKGGIGFVSKDAAEAAGADVKVVLTNQGGRDPNTYGKSLDIRPLNLTESELKDLMAFLEGLTAPVGVE
jgi:hypothetical protein